MSYRTDPCDNCGVAVGDCLNTCSHIEEAIIEAVQEHLNKIAILKEEIKELKSEIDAKDLMIQEQKDLICNYEYEMF